MKSCWDSPTRGDRAVELSLPREGALLSFEQLRPMTPGALHWGHRSASLGTLFIITTTLDLDSVCLGMVFAQSREDSWRPTR